MSKSTRELLIERIKEYVSDNNIQSLGIAWVGGEPLCDWRGLTEISGRLYDFCKKKKCKYVSSIITNATLLYPERSLKLGKAPYNVDSVQITLDGYWHDSTRKYRGKQKSTLAAIFKNLPAALDNLNVVIRINLPRDKNISKEKLADFICSLSRFSKKEVNWYIAGILGVTAESKAKVKKEWRIYDLSRFETEIHILVAKRQGKKYAPSLPLQRSMGCGFESRDSVCVDSEGYIYKCWHHLGNDEKIIGHIDNSMTWNQYIESTLFRKWLAWNPHEVAMCKQCLALPLCQGKCFDIAFQKGEESTARCDLIRYNLKKRVLLSTEAILEQRALASDSKPCGD